jgi:hypothetical protein
MRGFRSRITAEITGVAEETIRGTFADRDPGDGYVGQRVVAQLKNWMSHAADAASA